MLSGGSDGFSLWKNKNLRYGSWKFGVKTFFFPSPKKWGGGEKHWSLEIRFTKRTRMRFLVPWSTDRLSSRVRRSCSPSVSRPSPPGLKPSRVFCPSVQKSASTRAGQTHVWPGGTENLAWIPVLETWDSTTLAVALFFSEVSSRGRNVSYWRVLLLLLGCEAGQAKNKQIHK